jgi:exodeoxyribonuclease VIII
VRAYLDGAPEEPSDEQVFGSMFHMLLLESHRFRQKYHLIDKKPDCRTKEGKAEWNQLIEIHGLDRIVLRADIEEMQAMVDGAARNEYARPLMGAVGHNEISLVWHDSETGVRLKGRIDKYIPTSDLGPVVCDVKTTKCSHWRKFGPDACRYAYHVQAAIYHDGIFAVYGVCPRYFILAVEKGSVCPTVVYEVRPDELAHGRTIYRALIREFLRCGAARSWSAYADDRVVALTLEEWAMAERTAETEGQEEPDEESPALTGGVA